MKNFSKLILLGVAFVLFLIGISIPGIDSPLHIILVVASVAIGFSFYLVVFLEVVRSPELTRGERILWIVAIICLPVIGNMLYVLIHYSTASTQVPKPET